MDLPGLIEGTYEGKGLGTKFVKHTEGAKLVAHFVSYENPDPISTYKSLREEIKKISEDLYKKPEIVILTKSDEATPEKAKESEKAFLKIGLRVISTSIVDDKSISEIRKTLKNIFKIS
jgi:GTP-binding protein